MGAVTHFQQLEPWRDNISVRLANSSPCLNRTWLTALKTTSITIMAAMVDTLAHVCSMLLITKASILNSPIHTMPRYAEQFAIL